MNGNITMLIVIVALMFCVLGGITMLSHFYSLDGIKSKTVGDGQHGTARWATKAEIRQTYKHILFTPDWWRSQAENGAMEQKTPNGSTPPIWTVSSGYLR